MIKKYFTYFILVFIICATTSAQYTDEYNKWLPFKYFLGNWEGHETGVAGIGKGIRKYEKIMDGSYIYFRNTSTFEPQEKNPKGERHEDWTFFSFDNNTGNYIMREFNIEGFVNKYVLDSLSSDYKYFVFVSESSENAPPGLKARSTLEILNGNEFTETFEIAFPKKDYQLFLKNYWTRIIE